MALPAFSVAQFTVSNNHFEPGVVGGLKFGYFFKSIPYLGLEGETNVAPNRVRSQTRSGQSGGSRKQPGNHDQSRLD